MPGNGKNTLYSFCSKTKLGKIIDIDHTFLSICSCTTTPRVMAIVSLSFALLHASICISPTIFLGMQMVKIVTNNQPGDARRHG